VGIRYKAAIFDMDGVIIDSEPMHREVTYHLTKELGFSITDSEYDALAGRITSDTFQYLKERHGFQASVEGIPGRYDKLYMERLREGFGDKLIPGVGPLIESLHADGIPLAVASSAPMKFIEMILNTFKLLAYFDAVVSCDKLARPKPAPDIFLEAAGRLGVLPEYCMVIEDSENGVAAAKAAGMYCVGFRNPASGAQDLTRADLVLDSLTGEDLRRLWV